MKKSGITLLFLAITFIGFAQTKNFIDQPYIQINTRVDTLVTPDEIFLSITIFEKDTRGKISVEELETKMITQLKSIGIDTDKQLTLIDLSSNFKKYFLKQKDVLKTKSYSLLVYTGLDAGKAIVEMENLNISNVELTKTKYSKMDDLKLLLKTKAIRVAKQNALALVKPLGQKVGNAIFISDQTNSYYYDAPVAAIQVRGVSAANEQTKYIPANIEFQKINVECSVEVKFALE